MERERKALIVPKSVGLELMKLANNPAYCLQKHPDSPNLNRAAIKACDIFNRLKRANPKTSRRLSRIRRKFRLMNALPSPATLFKSKGVCFPLAMLKNLRGEFVGYLMRAAKGRDLGKNGANSKQREQMLSMEWKSVCSAVQGRGHAKKDIPCQDKVARREENGVLIAPLTLLPKNFLT